MSQKNKHQNQGDSRAPATSSAKVSDASEADIVEPQQVVEREVPKAVGKQAALPDEFQAEGDALREAMASDGDLESAYNAFVNAVLRKPARIQEAFAWLVNRFSGSISALAKIAQPAELVSELSLNERTLTNSVAIHWDSTGQVNRMVRFAEAMLAAQHKLGNANAAEFEVAMAASLAFGRPKLARQLIDVARPHLPEDEATLVQARRNLSAGLLLQGLTPDVRIFWTHQLRSPHRECDWKGTEATEAIHLLAMKLVVDSEEGALFKTSLPDQQWQRLTDKIAALKDKGIEASAEPAVREKEPIESGTGKFDDAPVVWADVSPSESGSKDAGEVFAGTARHEEVKEARSVWPVFVSGMAAGALLAVGLGWWWMKESGLLNEKSVAVAVPEPPPQMPAKPVPEMKPESKPDDEPKITVLAKPVSKPLPLPAVIASPTPVVIAPAAVAPSPAPLVVAPPVTVPSDPPEPQITPPKAVPASPLDKWRQSFVEPLNTAFPGLRIWHDVVATGTLKTAGPLVAGTHPTAFTNPQAHRALLKWLVIDPPEDQEVMRAVLNTLIRLSPPPECLELFEPVCEYGASNAPDVRRAADVTLDLFSDRMSAELKKRLQALVDSGNSPTNSAKK